MARTHIHVIDVTSTANSAAEASCALFPFSCPRTFTQRQQNTLSEALQESVSVRARDKKRQQRDHATKKKTNTKTQLQLCCCRWRQQLLLRLRQRESMWESGKERMANWEEYRVWRGEYFMCFQLLLDHGETNRLHLKETYKLGELHVYTHIH